VLVGARPRLARTNTNPQHVAEWMEFMHEARMSGFGSDRLGAAAAAAATTPSTEEDDDAIVASVLFESWSRRAERVVET
jgi:hypothetical protein